MAKWLNKYDAPKAQNGIEGTMGGLTDKGFNYNGAWGGPSMEMGGNIQPPMAGAVQTLPMYQMGGYVYPTTFVPEAEMGASLPGSVGFTYARTQGIPSEGPYGKKTVPSAQNGQEMQFYQNALDWTPRNISEYGSEIPMGQKSKKIPDYLKPTKLPIGDIAQQTGIKSNEQIMAEIVGAARLKQKKEQAARTRTTIGPDARTAGEKQKAREFTEQVNKRRKDLGFMEGAGHSQEYIDKKRAEADKILTAIEVGTLLEAPVSAGIKGVAKAAPRVGEYLTTQTPLKNAYKLNPWAFKSNPEAYYRMIGEGGYADALESGIIRANPKRGKFEVPYFAKGKPHSVYSGPYMAEYTADDVIFPKYNFSDYATPLETITVGNPNLKFYKQDWLKGFKEVPKSSVSFGQTSQIADDLFNPISDDILKYLLDDTKHPLFIRALGKIVPPGTSIAAPGLYAQVLNQSLSEEDKSKLPEFAREHLEKMANQFNIDSKLKQKKKGGVVKDNNGYWNPDNWGKVVEIDSPNITMKGVNQDLIGVSDTGDVQYMTSGNDYIFDGNRVKEYPAAKYGVNQQDEKTVQHLDQLLNFTNKPKAKNGWLSKYE
jgi:hypothetical protein